MIDNTILVVGASGQDGRLLAEYFIGLNKNVVAVSRSTMDAESIAKTTLGRGCCIRHYQGDITDPSFANFILTCNQYEKIYYLAAQSFVGASHNSPLYTFETSVNGLFYFLERVVECQKSLRSFVFFSSSESFGFGSTKGFFPTNPYGLGKRIGCDICNYFFAQKGLPGVIVHLFNHESEYRSPEFLVPKICSGVTSAMSDPNFVLKLGNLDAARDWGDARDYMRIVATELPDASAVPYVIGTGIQTSVKDIVKASFAICDIEVVFEGNGSDQIGVRRDNGKPIIKSCLEFFRPTDDVVSLDTLVESRKLNVLISRSTVLEVLPRLVEAGVN